MSSLLADSRLHRIADGLSEPADLLIVITACCRIKNGNGRADRDTGRAADRLRRTERHCAQPFAKPDIAVGHRLSRDQPVADQFHHFRAFCELAMVQAVATLELGEIENDDPGLFEFGTIWLDGWVHLAQSVDIAGDPPGQAERPVVLRHEKGETRVIGAELGELPAEHVDIEIR